MKNIEVLTKYTNDNDFVNMKNELKFSLFAVDNEFFEGNATFDKVSEFIYNSDYNSPIIDLLFINSDGNAIVVAKTILNDNILEIKQLINNIFLQINDNNSELINDIKSEKNDDTDEIIIFICLSNALTKESFDDLLKFYKKTCKGSKVKIIFKTINDILLTEKENSESISCVKSYELTIDLPNNYLKFNKNDDLSGVVVNLETSSIKELYDKYYQRGLLGANIRYFVKNKQIDDKIKNTLINEGNLFWFKNNGILLIAESYEIKDQKLSLKNFSIVNGGQTTYLLGNTDKNKDAYVMCKIVVPNKTIRNEKIISDIAEATNSQKPIKKQDIIANYHFVRKLKDNLLHTSKNKIMLEIKRGERRDKLIFPKNYHYIKSTAFAGLIVSTLQINPGKARNAVGSLFSSEDEIKKIFNSNINPNFYQDLIYLWNMYEDYVKYISKKNSLSKIKIKNNKLMKFYTISSTYVYYLLTTNPMILTNVRRILTDSKTPKNDTMELLKNVNTKDFKSMLKTYNKDDIFPFFSVVHKILDTEFKILKGIYKGMEKPFDMANITKTQKNFGEIFILPIIRSFIEDEQNNVQSYSFSIFENK